MATASLRRITAAVVLGAIAVSVIHYVDNYTAYEEYPRSETLPNPSAGLIAFAWFFFTAFALFSGSGLVGLLHYSVEGTGVWPWWRHAHVITDIAFGFTVLACAFALSRVRANPA